MNISELENINPVWTNNIQPVFRAEENGFFSTPLPGFNEILGMDKNGFDLLMLCDGKHCIKSMVELLENNSLAEGDFRSKAVETLLKLRNSGIIQWRDEESEKDNTFKVFEAEDKDLKRLSLFLKKAVIRKARELNGYSQGGDLILLTHFAFL